MLGLLSLVLLVILVVLLLSYFSKTKEKSFLKDLTIKFFAVVLTIACVYLFVRLLRFII